MLRNFSFSFFFLSFLLFLGKVLMRARWLRKLRFYANSIRNYVIRVKLSYYQPNASRLGWSGLWTTIIPVMPNPIFVRDSGHDHGSGLWYQFVGEPGDWRVHNEYLNMPVEPNFIQKLKLIDLELNLIY